MSDPTTNQQSPKNQNQDQNQEKQQEQKQANNQPNNGSRADQPTPVSPSTQSQGQNLGQNQGAQRNGSPTTLSGQPSPTNQSSSSDLKQVGREIVSDATREIKGEIQGAVSQVKDQASDLTNAVQEQATTYLDEQKGVAAVRLEGVAQAIRAAGEGFSEHDEGTLAHYSERLAAQIDSFSGTLREREVGALLDDARQLAYRQPEWFVAGALAAGFALGRFFKSSRNSRSGRGEQSYPYDNPSDYTGGFSSNYPRGYTENYEGGTTSDYGRGSSYRNPGSGQSNQYGAQSSPRHEPQYSRDYDAGFRPGSQSEYGGQSAGQVTTHGLGTGQSIQRQEEMGVGPEFSPQFDTEFGTDFGQVKEQASNYKGDASAIASSLPSSKSNMGQGEGQEGEAK